MLDINSLLDEYRGTIDLVLPRLLGILGEAIVCSELNNRGIEAEICRGNKRSVDLIVKGTKLRIQVKTSQRSRFVTRLAQKSPTNDDSPDFWVLLHINEEGGRRFFVLTHPEICEIQKARNEVYAHKYIARHGKPPDFSKGVDNVTLTDVKEFEDKWPKILDVVKREGR